VKQHSVASGIRAVVANLGLLRSLTRRDIEARYRGTVFGILWAVVYPLTMLAIYTFLFGIVFKARWPGLAELPDYILMLYCGLLTFNFASEILTRAPAAILSQPNYVKKIVFPLELLPLSQLGAALFNAVVGFALLILFLLVQKHHFAASGFTLPIVLAPLAIMLAGSAWFLAAFGVFFRDVSQIIGILMTMLMVMSPVFYPVSSAPAGIQTLIYLNPLTYPIEEVRRVLVLGDWPNVMAWVVYTGISCAAAAGGLWLFQRTRAAFADVV
jgi:lipopolysaccharide transport system permease protein